MSTQAQSTSAASTPRSNSNTQNLPEWKRRQLEKEKEEEERRQAETRVKLTKVASIKIRKDELGADRSDDFHWLQSINCFRVEVDEVKEAGSRPLFRAHAPEQKEAAPPAHAVEAVSTASTFHGAGLTAEEMEAAEEARLLRNFNKANKK